MNTDWQSILQEDKENLLKHKCINVTKEQLYLPQKSFIDKYLLNSGKNINVLRNLQSLFNTGRLANTGYLSILPIDQGVEHSAGASFSPNPNYFDPDHICKLALEGECSAVASTYGILASVSRKYAHKIPFIVKLNHNELLSYPNIYRQEIFATVDQAIDIGAAGIGLTIYFGSEDMRDELAEVRHLIEDAHNAGLFVIIWAYLRNPAFKKEGIDYHTSADLTGQANYLAATTGADIVKQKLATNNGGFKAINFGVYKEEMYNKMSSPHPIDLVRYQVINCYMGRVGMINSGGGSGKNDLYESTRTAIINKRAGGMGMIIGRKVFQKPLDEGLKILRTVQDVYLDKDITVA